MLEPKLGWKHELRLVLFVGPILATGIIYRIRGHFAVANAHEAICPSPHMHIIIDEYTRIIHLNYGSNSGARNASSIRKYICGRQCCRKTDAYKDTQCLENVACKR